MSKVLLYKLIVQFLDTEVLNGGYSDDMRESLSVARDCLSRATESGEIADITPSTSGQPEQQLLRRTGEIVESRRVRLEDVFLAGVQTLLSTRPDLLAGAESPQTVPGPSEARRDATDEERRMAEQLKTEGNQRMQEQHYEEAVQLYSRAIALVQDNAIYYCNRAAAYTKLKRYDESAEDCQRALQIDPRYSKAYYRLGCAMELKGDWTKAIEAYERAHEYEPSNSTYMQARQEAISRRDAVHQGASASPFGAAAAGGGFDLNSLMKNPAFMQMANSMMANPQTMQMLQRTFGEALGGAGGAAGAGGFGAAQAGAAAPGAAAGQQPPSPSPNPNPAAGQNAGATGTAGAAAGAPPGPANLSALLAMGQQLAAQMQASNPELVEQLREQFRSSAPPDRPPSS